MARTHIIAGDGTHFTSVSDARRRNRKIAAIAGLVIAFPFFCAAMVGIYLGLTEGLRPAADLLKPLPAALTACEDAPRQFQSYCIGLYLRPATIETFEDGSSHTTATGPELVEECMTPGLTRPELGACLTQPLN